ncbi:uncharacterized protein K444DRAFT_484794, partial [Hyaloscypha bicolor E]
IQCEIETYKLRDCPPFTALSYTWGAEDNEKEISLNGLSKTVRLNLARFLRHARDDMNSYPSGSASSHAPIGYLWIDALCINQENVRERNAQVAIMRDIYKEAKRIVRWLG